MLPYFHTHPRLSIPWPSYTPPATLTPYSPILHTHPMLPVLSGPTFALSGHRHTMLLFPTAPTSCHHPYPNQSMASSLPYPDLFPIQQYPSLPQYPTHAPHPALPTSYSLFYNTYPPYAPPLVISVPCSHSYYTSFKSPLCHTHNMFLIIIIISLPCSPSYRT